MKTQFFDGDLQFKPWPKGVEKIQCDGYTITRAPKQEPPTMNDELDGLIDEALDRVFAWRVAHWVWKPGVGDTDLWFDENCIAQGSKVPSFSTDANVVLPWLEQAKVSGMDIRRFVDGWGISLRVAANATAEWQAARAPSFARAACIALIRAAREKAKRS